MSVVPAAFRKKADAVGSTNPQAYDGMPGGGGQMPQMPGHPMMGMMTGQMGQMPGNPMMAMMGGMGGCGSQVNPAMMATMGGCGGPNPMMAAMGGCGGQPNPMMAGMGGCGQPNPAMMAAMGGYGGQPNPAMMAAMGFGGPPNPMMAMGGQPNPAMMAAMGGCGGESNPMMAAMGGCGGEANAMMAAMGGCGGDENPVMQAMMAQQLQFQQQLMDQDAETEMMDKIDIQQEQLHNFVKGKGKSKQKGLDVPERLKADPDKWKQLEEFMTENPFEPYHKNRLMAVMAKRMEDGDSWIEDYETLQMAMGGAKNKCALLVGIVKSMEDGTFKPREESVRAQFRRSQEIKQEAVEANNLLKKGGSIREKFEASQKKAAAQLEVHRNSPDRSRSRGRRSRSQGRNRRRSPSRGRGRSRSRDRRR